ncbi:MAG: flagellar cap protein FliD N-terminal domain-containing protein, partial [Lachnospiraceae bacterium]
MPIRLSGMASGLDTDTLVKDLMKSYSTRKDNIVKQQTKLEWKQDAWKEMNSKIYGFYSSSLSKMRFSSAYSLKSASISNSNLAKVSASSTAVSGTQTLIVKELASSGYLTGGQIKAKSGADALTGSSKLADIEGFDMGDGSGKVNLT